MSLFVNAIAAVVFVAVFRRAVKRLPVLFYVIAGALDILLIIGFSYGLPVLVWKVLMTFQSRGLFAFALFAIVMFAGVFREGSCIKRAVVTIRAELSIIAAILIAGHIVNYASIYLVRIFSPGSADITMVLSFIIAFVIIVLLIPLSVTSIRVVKKRMRAEAWKNVQRIAYLFFALIYVHIGLILYQPVSAGSQEAIISFVLYTALFGAYAILRTRRHLLDSKIEVVPLIRPTPKR